MRLLLSVLFLFPFLISLSSCQNCDAGWIDDGDQSCFKFDREVGNPTWSEALGYCIGQHAGAFLAEIRSGCSLVHMYVKRLKLFGFQEPEPTELRREMGDFSGKHKW